MSFPHVYTRPRPRPAVRPSATPPGSPVTARQVVRHKPQRKHDGQKRPDERRPKGGKLSCVFSIFYGNAPRLLCVAVAVAVVLLRRSFLLCSYYWDTWPWYECISKSRLHCPSRLPGLASYSPVLTEGCAPALFALTSLPPMLADRRAPELIVLASYSPVLAEGYAPALPALIWSPPVVTVALPSLGANLSPLEASPWKIYLLVGIRSLDLLRRCTHALPLLAWSCPGWDCIRHLLELYARDSRFRSIFPRGLDDQSSLLGPKQAGCVSRASTASCPTREALARVRVRKKELA